MKRALVIGGVSFDSILYMDHFPQPVAQTVFSKRFTETAGGAGSGKALNLNRLGFETTIHGLIGRDSYGDQLRQIFDRENITSIFDKDPAGTERHVNLMEDSGARISIFANYGTFEPEVDLDRLHPLIEKSDYVVLNIVNYCRHLIPIIKKAGKEIWCDVHEYDGTSQYHKDFVEAADYLFMNSEGMANYQQFMEHMIDQGKKLVVCTHGKEGADVMGASKKLFHQPIVDHYPLVDSNGAGDSFMAGFMYGHSRGYSGEKSMAMAAIAAGLCISSPLIYSEEASAQKLETEYQRLWSNSK